MQNRLAQAADHAQIVIEAHDPRTLADGLRVMGEVMLARGQSAPAVQCICRAIRAAQASKQPFLEGYADGMTFSRSIARAWWLLPKAFALGRIRYERAGRSRPLALAGPFRGLAYVFELALRRAQRGLGLAPRDNEISTEPFTRR